MREIRKKLIEETKRKIKESFSKELLIVQASRFLADLDKAIGSLRLRLRGWYSHYDMDVEDILKIKWKRSSLGGKFSKKDLEILKKNIEEIKNLLKIRESNVKYLKSLMKEKAPRLNEVAGEELGAKLIDLGGGVKRLASMASSKIQILGAEKALFRHLREKAKPPKYGVIFFHEKVQKSKDKGKAARKLAAEISKAVRIDYFRK